MCITTSRAKLSDTLVYVGEGHYKNEDVHVLAYQNKAVSLPKDWNSVAEANAMVLPFPTRDEMGPANILDTRKYKSFLKDISEASKHQMRTLGGDSFSLKSRGISKGVQIFDSGSYTVVLAENVNQIPGALQLVTENKRPKISDEFLQGYGKLYPNAPIAVCCWEGQIEAEPLLWWYKPTNKHQFFIPTMDAHDGRAPDVNASVDSDHIISVGSADNSRVGHMFQVHYKDALPDEVRGLLPSYVYGTKVKGQVKNGDSYVDTNKLSAGSKSWKDAPNLFRGVSFAEAAQSRGFELTGWAR